MLRTLLSKTDILLIGVTLLAAVSWLFSKEALGLMPPLLFISVRFLIAALILFFIARQHLHQLSVKQLKRCIGVGLVFGAGMSFWVMALSVTHHVGEGAFLTSLGVVLVPVFARLFFAERIPLSTWASLPLAVAGLALLTAAKPGNFEPGQLLFLIAAGIFAMFYILNTRVASGGQRHDAVPPVLLTAVALAVVSLLCGALSLLFEWPQIRQQVISPTLVYWVLLSAVVGTALRFWLQTYAQSLSSQSHAVVIMVLEPVWTALMAAFWLGESMHTYQLLGCTLIFFSLLLRNISGLTAMRLKRRGE